MNGQQALPSLAIRRVAAAKIRSRGLQDAAREADIEPAELLNVAIGEPVRPDVLANLEAWLRRVEAA
jgi:hypothetical protein